MKREQFYKQRHNYRAYRNRDRDLPEDHPWRNIDLKFFEKFEPMIWSTAPQSMRLQRKIWVLKNGTQIINVREGLPKVFYRFLNQGVPCRR